MARIRTIKPEFWTDEELTECSRDARLLFIGTWNFSDDSGNLDRSAKQLKARIFPLDNIDCELLIQELMTQRKLVEYSVSGKKYLHIRGFAKHQVINRPSNPQCPPYNNSLTTNPPLNDDSVSPPTPLKDGSRWKEGRKEEATPPGGGNHHVGGSDGGPSVLPGGGGPVGPSAEHGASLWDLGITLLCGQGIKESTARTFIGSLIKEWPEATVEDAMRAAVGKVEAKAYIRGVLKDKPKRGALDNQRLAL